MLSNIFQGRSFMIKNELIEELRGEIFKLRDERIRLDAELKAKTELLKRLESHIPADAFFPSSNFLSPRSAPRITWTEAILTCVRDLGAQASRPQINSHIGRYVQLTEHHLKKTEDGQEIYKHTVSANLTGLVRNGELRRVSRGTYELTAKGRSALSDAYKIMDESARLLNLTAQSDPVLAELWDNELDAAYDEL